MVDKKQLIINLSFIFVLGIVVYTLIDLYTSHNVKTQYRDLSNPLGLEITDVDIIDGYMYITVYNPTNETASISISLIGLKNSYGSTAAITFGGDIGTIKYIKPKDTVIVKIPTFYTDPKRVITQWERGGNLSVAFYYNSADGRLSGVVFYVLSK